LAIIRARARSLPATMKLLLSLAVVAALCAAVLGDPKVTSKGEL
jgi:hypothetical protein